MIMIFTNFTLLEALKPESNFNTLTKVVIDADSDEACSQMLCFWLFINVALVTARQHLIVLLILLPYYIYS